MDKKGYYTRYWRDMEVLSKTSIGTYEVWRREILKKKIGKGNFLMDVLEHILDPEHLFGECKRVLKNKGLLIISVPNMLNLLNRCYFLCGIFKDITDINHKQNLLFSEHIRVFSKKVLEKLIDRKGLVYISKDYYFPQHISEEPWKRLSLIGRCIYCSSLFSRNFLFVCVKNNQTNRDAV